MIGHEQIVIFGFGSQGSAQGKNLKESGFFDVRAFVRGPGPRADDVRAAGIDVTHDPIAAAKGATIAAILISDGAQGKFYREFLEPNLPKGAAILFAHGFAVHYQQIVPRSDLDVILVGPLGHGSAVRENFLSGGGVPCAIAVAKDATGRAKERALAYARGISKRGPFIDTTFAEEVESDLFAEQAVLCGGVPELIRAAFDTLVADGHNPDIAYLSCLRELKAIIELVVEHGIAGMRERISNTARYGALTRGTKVIDGRVRETLRGILRDIRSGEFANEMLNDPEATQRVTEERLLDERHHQIEKIHNRLKRS